MMHRKEGGRVGGCREIGELGHGSAAAAAERRMQRGREGKEVGTGKCKES